jgi:hypothetical protein
MSLPGHTPLASLVLFICCLAIAASLFAALHYLVIDLPAQKNVQAPENAGSSKSNCDLCKHNCKVDKDYYLCLSICKDLECSGEV